MYTPTEVSTKPSTLTHRKGAAAHRWAASCCLKAVHSSKVESGETAFKGIDNFGFVRFYKKNHNHGTRVDMEVISFAKHFAARYLEI